MTARVDLLPLSTIPPTNFETERLRLRAMTAGDAQLVFDLYANDPVAAKYMSFRVTGRVEDSALFTQSVARSFAGDQIAPVRNHYAWIVERRSDGEPLGSTGFESLNAYTLSGGYIFNQRWWGQGYASEAWRCLVQWAIQQPGVFRFQAIHDLENPASGKVMEKVGMKFEGILKRFSNHPNVSPEPRDAAMYAWTRP